MPPKPSLSFLWQRLKRNAAVITTGGSWSVQLPSDIQRNLRWYFMDGVFSASQEAINVTYLTLFVLALGASKTQIGLMTSLASLSAVILLLPGALLSERLGQRKWVVIASGGGVTRLTILALALLPFFAHGSLAVWIAIALKVLMDGFANLGMPAWTSLSADIVPLAWRGRFFSTRNIVMGAAIMLVTFIAGQIITLAGTPIAGYQIVYDPEAGVYHGHRYRLGQLFRRNFDSGYSLRGIAGDGWGAVARFFRGCNVIDGEISVESGQPSFRCNTFKIPISSVPEHPSRPHAIAIRAEDIHLGVQPGKDEISFPAVVERATYRGVYTDYVIAMPGGEKLIASASSSKAESGAKTTVCIRKDAIVPLEAEPD